MKNSVLEKLKEIKLFLFDLDGVLIHNDNVNNLDSIKTFLEDIKNYVEYLSNYGLKSGIVTARKEDEIILELKKLESIYIIASTFEKVQAVEKLIAELGIDFKDVFYTGDEVLDIPLLSKCGLSAAPAWAGRDVKRSVNFIFKGISAHTILPEISALIKSVHTNK
ncbi:MAG: HAD hydrolase family protein [Melioribacteraceae bacterium]|nr:HAD hydrolase family protein [Melioribacteraceae bacterium]